jgi:hypothetical protein
VVGAIANLVALNRLAGGFLVEARHHDITALRILRSADKSSCVTVWVLVLPPLARLIVPPVEVELVPA